MRQRDHGGDLGAARLRHGAGEWIDLSTGINRRPYPLPPLPVESFTALPPATAFKACADAARAAYGAPTTAACLPLAGAQAAIGLVPRLRPPGRVTILGPTYNEHAAAFHAEGWQVRETSDPEDLAGAEAAVVVNPNNPTGRILAPETLRALTRSTGLLILDESFADTDPANSLIEAAGTPGLILLRSLGKFYGLAGLRLGFALGAEADIARLADLAGPWAVSGPALAGGALALADQPWAEATRARLAAEALRLDALATQAGWQPLGGTALFRLYDTPDATAARENLAAAHIWTRAFPYSSRWLRLGLPGPEAEWTRLTAALIAVAADRYP